MTNHIRSVIARSILQSRNQQIVPTTMRLEETSVNKCILAPFTILFQYFVFDFHMAPVMLYDKIISFTVSPPQLNLTSLLCTLDDVFKSNFS